MSSGRRATVTTLAFSSSGPNRSRPSASTPARAARASRAWRAKTALEPLLEDQVERHVERPEEGHGRGERGVGRLLLLALRRCAASRGSSGRRGFSAASAIARSETEANARPGGHISDFCEPATTTSTPHSSWGSSTAPRPETASTQRTESWASHDLVERPDVVDDAGRGLGLGDEDGPRGTIELAQRLVEARRVDLLAPLELDVRWCRRRRRRTARPSARRTCRTRRPPRARRRATRLATADSMAPVPVAAKQSTSFSVWKTRGSRSSTRA